MVVLENCDNLIILPEELAKHCVVLEERNGNDVVVHLGIPQPLRETVHL